jgi:glutathione S-transferase
VITLYQFPPGFGLPNASPFCLKLEFYLRMAELPYRNRYTLNLQRAPKGKLPWIDDEGTQLADSGLIIDYLKGRHGDPLDSNLDARQRATALTVQRLVEEHLYWAVLRERWIDEDGWALTRKVFFGALPWPARAFVPLIAKRGIRAELMGHGLGRHAVDDIRRMAADDLSALAALLGEQPYMLGDQPTSVDACVAGFLSNVLRVPLENPIKTAALQHTNLVAYCDRMLGRYFPEIKQSAACPESMA